MKALWAWGAALLLAAAYLLNLGSVYAPTNGDEMVYLHIARLTSESGHWLPLVSDLQTPTGSEMRNTKPPLLFWQAMFVGQFDWRLAVLRLPYVLQTLMCALVVAYLLSRTIAQQTPLANSNWQSERGWLEIVNTPLLGAMLYLGFFATYRYGRPVLSSSTESLFLFLICALVICKWHSWKHRPIRLAAASGLLMIPALLTKSFVLVAPIGLWLFAMVWMSNDGKAKSQKFWQGCWPAAGAVLIGLVGFALWLAIDPNPQAVWREFVVGENFSNKFNEQVGDSFFAIWLAPLLNAGLLAPLVLGLLLAAWRERANLAVAHKALWLWLAAWLIVFSLPQTRSARYVIPAMPAVAVLIVLYAHHIHRIWWVFTLGLIALATVVLGWIAWCLDGAFAAGSGYSIFYFIALSLLLVFCAVGLVRVRWRVVCTAMAAVAWLALLGALAAPFDAPSNQYGTSVQAQFLEKKILVPQNFNAQSERFVFVLPGSKPMPYEVTQGLPPTFNKGDIIASRLVLRSRHAAGEVTWATLSTRESVQRLLVEREVLMHTALPE